MKFTEEQFKQLVKIQAKYFPLTMLEQGVGGKNPYDAIHETDIKLSDFVWNEKLGNEAVALMNPVTREWAHEQYVEKEKKYVWRDKYTGYVIYKMLNDWSLSATALGEKHFTETELKNSPFKPEWFDKEEVE